MKYRYTDTPTLMQLARLSKGRNRSVDIAAFSKAVDPEGCHLLQMTMPHNDVEWRTMWLVKLQDTMTPATVFLDVPMKVDLDAATAVVED